MPFMDHTPVLLSLSRLLILVIFASYTPNDVACKLLMMAAVLLCLSPQLMEFYSAGKGTWITWNHAFLLTNLLIFAMPLSYSVVIYIGTHFLPVEIEAYIPSNRECWYLLKQDCNLCTSLNLDLSGGSRGVYYGSREVHLCNPAAEIPTRGNEIPTCGNEIPTCPTRAKF
jgi:hypothetical protein